MYTNYVLVIMSVLSLVFTSFVAAAPKIQSWQSQTGANVFFVAEHNIPIIDIAITFDAGSARDGENYGLSQLTSSLLDEGAAGISADQISQGFDEVGAQYGVSARRDSVSMSLRSLIDTAILQAAVTNFTRVLTQPDFPEDALNRQRNRLLINIRGKQQSPGVLANDAFFATVFGEHSYASPVSGIEKTVSALTRSDVVNFHKLYYVAENATVAIVGDLTTKQARSIVESLFKDLPRGAKPKPIAVVDDLQKSVDITLNYSSAQAHILLGQTGVKRGDEDYFAFYVGNHILGGGGMVSRLFEEVREKRGLSYSVSSYFLPMREKGVFIASLQTRTDQTQIALDVLKENLQAFIEDGPNEVELDAAKQNITGGFPLRLNSNKKVLNYISMIGFYGLPNDYLDVFNANVNAVTVKQIKNVFKRRLSLDNFVTVIVGPDLSVDSVQD